MSQHNLSTSTKRYEGIIKEHKGRQSCRDGTTRMIVLAPKWDNNFIEKTLRKQGHGTNKRKEMPEGEINKEWTRKVRVDVWSVLKIETMWLKENSTFFTTRNDCQKPGCWASRVEKKWKDPRFTSFSDFHDTCVKKRNQKGKLEILSISFLFRIM